MSQPPTFHDVVIRGMHFRGQEAKDYAQNMQPGDKLTLKREPENRFDENAIMTITPEGMHLGYIGKEYAGWLAGWLDEGHKYIAVCQEVQYAQNNHYPIMTVMPEDEDHLETSVAGPDEEPPAPEPLP